MKYGHHDPPLFLVLVRKQGWQRRIVRAVQKAHGASRSILLQVSPGQYRASTVLTVTFAHVIAELLESIAQWPFPNEEGIVNDPSQRLAAVSCELFPGMRKRFTALLGIVAGHRYVFVAVGGEHVVDAGGYELTHRGRPSPRVVSRWPEK